MGDAPHPAEIEALASRCWRSPVEFCRVFLPDWFPTKMPWVHRGLLALLSGQTEFLLDFGQEEWRDEVASWTPADLGKILTNFVEEGPKDASGNPTVSPIFELDLSGSTPRLLLTVRQNVAVMMPRGFSKTTILNASNLRDLVYKAEDFFLYVSESGAHAERQLGTVKGELEKNETLRLVFGDLVAGRQSPLKWTDNYIEPTNEVMVGAVGMGGQIRGFSKGAKRPGKIVYDDLQNMETMKSETQRKVDKNWFFQTALPTPRKGGRNIAIGTLLGEEAIMALTVLHPEFTTVRFGAIDRQGDPLWAWQMNLGEIEKKKLAATAVGELPGFYLEYMSEARSDSARMFPSNKLIYIQRPMESIVGMALAEDPAISDEATSDFACFAVVGIETTGKKHLFDFHAEKGMDPAAQVEKFFELHANWLCKVPADFRRHGIEAIGFQRALVHLVKGEQFARSRYLGMDAYFEVQPIFHGKVGKIARVQGIMKPLIHSGYWTMEQNFPTLTQQFLDWPTGKKDGPDVCAMAVGLLDPFAALNLPDSTGDLLADTAPPLQLSGGCP